MLKRPQTRKATAPDGVEKSIYEGNGSLSSTSFFILFFLYQEEFIITHMPANYVIIDL